MNAKLEIFRIKIKIALQSFALTIKIAKQLAKLFPKKFKSSLIQISTQSRIDNGIYLKDSLNGIKIYNNLSSEVIFFENKLIKIHKGKKHNLQNFLATYATCYLLNKDKNFKSSFDKIVNLEHRLEFVKEYKKYISIMIVKLQMLNLLKVLLIHSKIFFGFLAEERNQEVWKELRVLCKMCCMHFVTVNVLMNFIIFLRKNLLM